MRRPLFWTKSRVNVLTERTHLRLEIHGLVQGVGFRPFVFRMAQACGVKGWVQNTGEGVVIEASGHPDQIHQFIQGLSQQKPEGTRIEDVEVKPGQEANRQDFVILESRATDVTTYFPLDVAICAECRRELFSAANRRFQYPFITCARCGPRFTIVRALPFDRQNTSMSKFKLCPQCAQEYSDPTNRRFHAQTISCPQCGPQLSLIRADNAPRARHQDAIMQAAALLIEGGAVAVKGIGGYHIAVDALNEAAVQRLRQKKQRPDKPFAVMFPDLARLREFAQPTDAECQALLGPVAPIVLVKPYPHKSLAPSVSGGAPLLGAMLPQSPLHLLLIDACDRPLVMTSGNPAKGPVIIHDGRALEQLLPLVDALLIHDRDILHHADDSVVRCKDRKATVLRLGRGLAPCVIPCAGPSGILALGGHQKNSFALTNQNKLFVSQDMGNLDDYQNLQRLEAEIHSWLDLMKLHPVLVLHDQHPDYGSSRLAPRLHQRTFGIQHHEAHVMACVLEQQPAGSGLALAWDGWGLGNGDELWGGEVYDVNPEGGSPSLRRIGTLHPFCIAGGDKAAREPWRCALGVAHALFAEDAHEALERYGAAGCLREKGAAAVLLPLLSRGMASKHCRSVGRIFDAVASFLDITQACTYEGQAAIYLEGLVDEASNFEPYPMKIHSEAGLHILDWRPGIMALLTDIKQGAASHVISARFHQMWIQGVLMLLEQTEHECVFLSGGVFQNAYFDKVLREQLEKRHISVHSPKGLPLHDGNLAPGQVLWALSRGIL